MTSVSKTIFPLTVGNTCDSVLIFKRMLKGFADAIKFPSYFLVTQKGDHSVDA